MLRQIQLRVQNGTITKNGVLPVTTLFFWKFCFGLRTSYKELNWCTNYPNAHIPTFCKHWSFIWRCFFLESILNIVGTPPYIFVTVICRGNLTQLFAVAICRENLLWLFAVCCFVYVRKPFLCVSQSLFFVGKSFLIESKPFLNLSKTFLFMRISLLKVFLFVIVVAVMGHCM